MKHVLLITRDFAPYCARTGWMIRAVSLANFLVENGIELQVLATKRKDAYNSLQLNSKVQVNWVYNYFEHFDGLKTNWMLKVSKLLRKLREKFSALIGEPLLDASEFALTAYKAEIKRLQHTKPLDSIIFSTPPHSLLLLTKWIRKEYPNIKIIIDMRDAWSLRPVYLGQPSKASRVLEEERACLLSADLVTFVSKGMKELYEKIIPMKQTLIVENGFIEQKSQASPSDDIERVIETDENRSKVFLGYFGSGSLGMRGEKDISPIVEAIAGDEELRQNIILILQGNFSVSSQYEHLPFVKIFPPTTNEISLANIKLVDVAINYNTDQVYAPCIIGGKVYEYISLKKPLLAIAHANAISLIDKARETNGFFADISKPEGIQQELRKILKAKREGRLNDHFIKDDARIRDFAREAQYKKFLDFL